MRIIAFSDYRVQSIDALADFIQNQDFVPDLILYAGDDINRFVEVDEHLNAVLTNRFEILAKLAKHGICAVIGNDDVGAIRKYISGEKVYDVHKAPLMVEDYAIIGIEGAIFDPDEPGVNEIGFTLYPETQVQQHLEMLKKKAGSRKMIILSHTPPRGLLDFAMRFGQRHIGSKALRRFIEKNNHRISLAVCGHVHLQGGRDIRLGKTTVVNAASHDYIGESGRVAIINIQTNGEVKVEWHEIREGLDLYGIGPATAKRLAKAGIYKIEHIASITPELLAERIACSIKTATDYYIRAKSVQENKVYVLRPLVALDDNPIFLDIETNIGMSLVWLIGVYHAKADKFVRYFADSPQHERNMLTKFIRDMTAMKGTIYTFSGSRFDERVLKARIEENRLDHSRLPRFVDIYHDIRRSVIFPLKSYSLKQLAKYFGYNYRHQDLDGMRVALDYMLVYQKTKDKKLLMKLFEYNEDDVRSLPAILSKLTEVTGVVRMTQSTQTSIQITIPHDKRAQLAIVKKYYQRCGSLMEKSSGRKNSIHYELRFRTKDPIALREIRDAMAALGFREGSYQEWHGKGYLPYYGNRLLDLLSQLRALN